MDQRRPLRKFRRSTEGAGGYIPTTIIIIFNRVASSKKVVVSSGEGNIRQRNVLTSMSPDGWYQSDWQRTVFRASLSRVYPVGRGCERKEGSPSPRWGMETRNGETKRDRSDDAVRVRPTRGMTRRHT